MNYHTMEHMFFVHANKKLVTIERNRKLQILINRVHNYQVIQWSLLGPYSILIWYHHHERPKGMM